MTTIQSFPRWRVQVEGDEEDIKELERLVNGHIASVDSVFFHRFEETVPTLTTTIWDQLDNPNTARIAAASALRLFTGAMNTFDVSGPLSVGTIYEVQTDGRYQMTRYSEIKIVVRKVLSERVNPAEFSRALQRTMKVDWMASAFIDMSPHPDWYSIFRVIEAIEKHFGNEKKMTTSKDIDGKRLKLIKRMANSIRHFPDGTHTPPNPSIKIEDATADVRQALTILVNKV